MDKLLILGINGFTGKHIQKYITDRQVFNEYKFIGVDQQIDKISNIDYIEADVTKYSTLQKLLTSTQPDYIINLVGIYKRGVPFDTLLEINALITKNIFDIILNEKIDIKKTLVVGTAAEYGIDDKLPIKESRSSIPLSEYGLAKSIQTAFSYYYYSNFGLDINIARPFNIIGENISEDLAIGSFVHQVKKIKSGDTIYVGNLMSKRDYLDISDVIHAYFCILKKGVSGKIYNICSGKSYCMKDILNHLIHLSKKEIYIAKNKAFVNKYDIPDIYGDNARLRNDTGWEPQLDVYRSLEMAMVD